MRKTYKYRLAPSSTVENKLHWVLARCRELSNAALSERKDAYRIAGKSITYYDQQNTLPELKAEIREEYQEIAAHVLQDVLKRLDKAFQRFFDRCAKGQKPGYPRFQGRNRYDSFTYVRHEVAPFEWQAAQAARPGSCPKNRFPISPCVAGNGRV